MGILQKKQKKSINETLKALSQQLEHVPYKAGLGSQELT